MSENTDTKEKILVTTLDLFHKNGYDKTSVAAIIKAVGISKGGFYHYFSSKEDLLEEISHNYASKSLIVFDHIINLKDLNAVEKLNTLFNKIFSQKEDRFLQRVKLIDLAKSDSDTRLKNKMNKSIINVVKTRYLRIIEQGIDEGLFYTDSKEDVAEMLPKLGIMLNEEIIELIDVSEFEFSKIEKKILFYEKLFNSMLGCKESKVFFASDSISYNKNFIKKYMEHKKGELK